MDLSQLDKALPNWWILVVGVVVAVVMHFVNQWALKKLGSRAGELRPIEEKIRARCSFKNMMIWMGSGPLVVGLIALVLLFLADVRFKNEKSDFEKYLHANPQLFSPQMIQQIGASKIDNGRLQFFLNPLRKDACFEFTKYDEDAADNYLSGIFGGLLACKRQGGWAVEELRGFGPG